MDSHQLGWNNYAGPGEPLGRPDFAIQSSTPGYDLFPKGSLFMIDSTQGQGCAQEDVGGMVVREIIYSRYLSIYSFLLLWGDVLPKNAQEPRATLRDARTMLSLDI